MKEGECRTLSGRQAVERIVQTARAVGLLRRLFRSHPAVCDGIRFIQGSDNAQRSPLIKAQVDKNSRHPATNCTAAWIKAFCLGPKLQEGFLHCILRPRALTQGAKGQSEHLGVMTVNQCSKCRNILDHDCCHQLLVRCRCHAGVKAFRVYRPA